MLLKRYNKKGDKYYIESSTGRPVKIMTVNPLKREANAQIALAMKPKIRVKYSPSTLKNDLRSRFIGDYVRIMRLIPENRDVKEFIKICKRINMNPWPFVIFESQFAPIKQEAFVEDNKISFWHNFMMTIKHILNYIINFGGANNEKAIAEN